jgi:hypothetical protein
VRIPPHDVRSEREIERTGGSPGEAGAEREDFRRADVELPVVRLLKGAKLAGYFNVDTDDDGILRRAAPLCRLGDRVVPSLPLAAAMLAAPGAEFTAHEIRLEAASQRLGRDGTFLINYRGPQDSYPKVRPSEMVKAGSLLDAWRKGGRVPSVAHRLGGAALVLENGGDAAARCRSAPGSWTSVPPTGRSGTKC